jgi:hypothetical protein
MDIKIKRFLLLCCTFTLSVTTYGFGMQGVANGQPAGNGNGNHAGNQRQMWWHQDILVLPTLCIEL